MADGQKAGFRGSTDPENLVSRIIEEARAERARILGEAKKKAEARQGTIRAEVEREVSEWLKSRRSSLEVETGRAVVAERMKARRSLLARRREVLDALFSRALADLSSDRSFLEKFYASALAGLEPGRYSLEVSAGLGNFLPERWWRDRDRGPEEVEIEFAGFREEIGEGIVLRRESVEIALSPARLLDLNRETIERKAAGIIFSDSERRKDG